MSSNDTVSHSSSVVSQFAVGACRVYALLGQISGSLGTVTVEPKSMEVLLL